MTRSKIFITLFTLMLCMGIFCIPAFAYSEPAAERLSVTTSWSDGDLLRVEVLDNQTGAASVVELRLSDYSENAETITIQAVDADGNKSGVIVVTNPYYKAPSTDDTNGSTIPTDESTPPPSESAVPDDAFTPDGTGTVVDNVTEKNGKEFFSITTEAGNEFFLIVDRQRDGENVYLLNAVTENDLMALAKKGDGTTVSAVPSPEPAPTTPTPTPEPEPDPDPKDTGGGSSGSIIFIILAVVVVGGAGYYFKIVKPKKQAPEPDDYDPDPDYEDDSDEPGEYDKEEDTE